MQAIQRKPRWNFKDLLILAIFFWVRNIRLRDGFCFRGTRTLHQKGLASPSLMRPKVVSHSEPIWCSLVLNRGAGKSLEMSVIYTYPLVICNSLLLKIVIYG